MRRRRLAPDVPGGPVSSRMSSPGQALVEFALILPISLVLLLVAGDLARLYGTQVALEGAARAGALEAARHPTSYQAGQPCNPLVNLIVCATLNEALGSSAVVAPADVSVTCLPSPCSQTLGSDVRVAVVGHFQLLTPLLAPFTGGQNFDLTATATAQIAVHPAITSPSATPGLDPSPSPSPDPTPGPGESPSAAPTETLVPSPTPTCFPPTSDFSINQTTGTKKKTEFRFTDMSWTTPECPLTWSWNFGDGAGDSTSSLQNPTHIYDAKGTYTISLVVSNSGSSASRTRTVMVVP